MLNSQSNHEKNRNNVYDFEQATIREINVMIKITHIIQNKERKEKKET